MFIRRYSSSELQWTGTDLVHIMDSFPWASWINFVMKIEQKKRKKKEKNGDIHVHVRANFKLTLGKPNSKQPDLICQPGT